MAKDFAARVSKKNRKTIDLSDRIDRDLMDQMKRSGLLQGASLLELKLADIVVLDQVRTKFNDGSLKELGKNIKENGLIQPLVVHRKGKKFVLICGERRFRAMSLIKMVSAPCFVLENKSQEELMAIQFSENSSREALHFIDKADGILNYQKATKASERKITAALGISKSEVHRSLLIAKLPKRIKEAAKVYDIEKYVLLEWDVISSAKLKKSIEKKLLDGEVTKRSQLKKILSAGSVIAAGKKRSRKAPAAPKGLSANAFLKAMKAKTKDMDLDPETMKALKKILKETRDIVDL